MRDKKVSARDKTIQKMTRDGAVSKNLSDKSTVNISQRASDTPVYHNRDPDKRPISKAVTGRKKQKIGNGNNGKGGSKKTANKANTTSERPKNQQEKPSPKKQAKKRQNCPQTKKRLKFEEENSNSKSDGGGVNKKKSKLEHYEKKVNKAAYKAQKAKKRIPHQSAVRMERVFDEETEKVHHKLKVEQKPVKQKRQRLRATARKAEMAGSAAVHRKIHQVEHENAAVEGVNKISEAAEGVIHAKRFKSRVQRKRAFRRADKLEHKADKAAIRYQYQKELSEHEELRKNSFVKKIWQKQQIKRRYQKQKRADAGGYAAKGTIEYIKKVGGKVTDFFKEHKKVIAGAAAIITLLLLIMSSLSSCATMFFQDAMIYTGSSYLSDDEAIRLADLYYTQLEANLQQRIDQIEADNPGYEEYRYNIGPIEHDPIILISYLSAKYGVFTYEQVISELNALFAAQYSLDTQGEVETRTVTKTVMAGESLGDVVTSGYCNCSICCGQWAGGPTASGVMPQAEHTLAVDANTPLVPIGTEIIMNGHLYKVEDTGNFTRYGVDFDVYCADHTTASAWGHQTFTAYLAGGSNPVEVTVTETVKVMSVTLNNNSLLSLCGGNLSGEEKQIFEAYNAAKGNLQMFGSPYEYNWHMMVSSYYGYRKHPIEGEIRMHNGLDIVAREGEPVKSGLTGTVKTSTYNDSYGNYVILEDDKGYELLYAHLQSRSVSSGQIVTVGDEVGLTGSTGNSTGSHLHLEMYYHGERQNPIFYIEFGSGDAFGGAGMGDETFERLMQEATKHLGTPYVWGGYAPGGFDCSGFVSYVFTYSGVYNTGRLTAQGLHDISTPVSESEVKPGDLVFFTGTYATSDAVTHIGIYVGGGMMIHCGNPIQYASIYSPYWQTHFYGFGRLV